MHKLRNMNKRDLVVIGGGAGGLVVASAAAQSGLDVVLVEKESQLGGDCLHYGCVPSKALLKSAQVAHYLRTADRYGFHNASFETDMSAVNAVIQDAIDTIQPHDSHERFRALGCEVISGEAKFINADSIEVADKIIQARYVVIATGSSPWIPPIEGLAEVGYLTNQDMFSLEQLPRHLLILGGGPVGVEMAQAYARLGSRVSLIEAAPQILPRSNVRVSTVLAQQLADEGVEIITAQHVVRVEASNTEKHCRLSSGRQISGDQLLVAAGRRAVVAQLALESAGVDYTSHGIRVNSRLQTSQHHIYACGDVTGLIPLTHVAEQQAGVIIANIIFRIPKRMNYDVIPSVIYTDPECAEVGLQESMLQQDNSLQVVEFEMSALDRAIAEHETAGFARLVVRKGRLVGASIVGQRAGEIIHELALAIRKNMRLSEIAGMVHAYPSFAQINRRAAGMYYKDRLFNNRTRRLVRFLHHWLP